MSMAAAAVPSLVQGYGQLRQGFQEQQAHEYNARIAEQNARLSRQQASIEGMKFRRETYKQLGSMRAAYGASGVTLEGSPLDVLAESAAAAELDALTIHHRGEAQAYGLELSAEGERMAGRSKMERAYFSAAGKLMESGQAAASAGAGK